MPLTSEGRRRRARLAANRRHHPDRPELVEDDQRTLRADAAARYIAKLVHGFPPLTAAQRDRLAALLHSPNASDADAASSSPPPAR